MSFLEKISTKPNRDSYIWKGHLSIFAFILLWGLWLARLFSLLQWVKIIYRKIVEFINHHTRDHNSKRTNVPSILVEIYFLIWFILLSSLYFLDLSNTPIARILSSYFLFESIIWILYYAVFRRFYEEDYKIYHVLEYFVVLIIVFPIQAFAVANIFCVDFGASILAVLGVSPIDNAISVGIFGVVYQAIVIGIIISSFPSEKTKEGELQASSIILGNGDVVKNRLIPEILRRGDIVRAVFDKCNKDDKNSSTKNIQDNNDFISKVSKMHLDKNILWISTPSYTHVSYLSDLIQLNQCRLIVVEKPIAISNNDLDIVLGINANPEWRSHVFYLSYYLLEKALPLYYLAEKNDVYKRYLDIQNDELFCASLGKLVNVRINLFEGDDHRQWVNDNGGQLYETMIHNILMATIFTGLPQKWNNVVIQNSPDKSESKITANFSSTHIILEQKKNVSKEECCRYGIFEYEHGTLYMDIDEQKLLINNDNYGSGFINVKEEFKYKYAIQVDLVNRVFSGELKPQQCDGLNHQIECLKWINDYKPQNK